MNKWIEVNGRIVRGHGVAGGGGDTPYPDSSIKLQAPHFLAGGLDLSVYHPASLNVSIAPRTLAAIRPEYTFPHVEWTPLHPPETFSFSRCAVVYQGKTYNSLIYYPHPETKEAHFQEATMLEVIAPFIPNIGYDSEVTLRLNRSEIILDSTAR